MHLDSPERFKAGGSGHLCSAWLFFYLYRYLPLRISAVARKHRQNLGGDANDRR